MTDRRIPPRRRRRADTAGVTTAPEPRDFKSRLAKAASIRQATDDGYLEVERDDRLDYCDMPMIFERWETRHADVTYTPCSSSSAT